MKRTHWLFLGVICFFLVLFLARPINLITADLGRFLVNGRYALVQHDILETNKYSYTAPDYPFLNHHWAAGVIFYLIQQIFGFPGLSLFFILLSALTLLLAFDLARRLASPKLALVISLLMLPFITFRTEIRPEVFSSLFTVVFLWILFRSNETLFCHSGAQRSVRDASKEASPLVGIESHIKRSYRAKALQDDKQPAFQTIFYGSKMARTRLFLLPLFMLLWVNLHIYFFLGLLLIVALLIPRVIQEFRAKKGYQESRRLALVLILSLLATLLNPRGLTGALYPLVIFRNYGYALSENRSVFISADPRWILAVTVVYVLFLLSLKQIYKVLRGKDSQNALIVLILAAGTVLLPIQAIRNLPLFGYLALPLLAFCLKSSLTKQRLFTTALLFACLLFALFLFPRLSEPFGIGLDHRAEHAADFFTANKLHGPVFNNYDIGGYLIYHFYPREAVFIDNRPEAYPASFIQHIYIPMQEGGKWEQEDATYHFNVIFFATTDMSSWSRVFLFRRTHDPDWVPVYLDDKVIILVKNVKKNEAVIRKFTIPQSALERRFQVY